MAPANPEGKAVRPAWSAFSRGRRGREIGEAEEGMLQPSQHDRTQDYRTNKQKCSGADPDAKAPIFWIMHRFMSGIESNH